MSVLLDTDAYSALVRGHPVVATRVWETDRVLLSTIVVGELLFGFRCGTRYEGNRKNLELFVRTAYVTETPLSRYSQRGNRSSIGIDHTGSAGSASATSPRR